MNAIFVDGLDELYRHAKFGGGEIVLRAPAVGAKTWCLYVFYRQTSAIKFTRKPIIRFAPQGRPVAPIQAKLGTTDVFRMDCAFRCTTQFSFSLLGGATIFAKLLSKIAKSPKIGGKHCVHHFV